MFNLAMRLALRTLSTLYPPQKPLVFSGSGSTGKLIDLLLANGGRRPLLVTDNFLLKNGMLDNVIAQLDEAGAEVTIFSGTVPNPSLAVVEAGLKMGVEDNCDSCIAIGGGSVIDTAKVISAALTNQQGVAKLVGILKVRTPPVPFYVVPTTSGTGSEVTTAAVISDPQTHRKQFFVDPKYIPLATALDPEILHSLPPSLTATTGMDALTHAVEAYTSRNRFADTDRDAALAIKLIFQYLPRAYNDGSDLEAREKVALASFLAGYAFTKSSLGYVHAISHQISALYNTAHGLANAVILPRVLRFNLPKSYQRFANLERFLSGQQRDAQPEELAEAFIKRVDLLSERLNIPENLAEIKAIDFRIIERNARSEARFSYAVPRTMNSRQVRQILTSLIEGKKDISFA